MRILRLGVRSLDLELKRLEEHSSGSFQTLSIDPTPFFGAEEGNDASDVIRQPHAAQGDLRGEKLLGSRMLFESFPGEIGLDCAWCDGIGADSARPEFLRQIAGEDLDRTLH